jgi:hypothetical protein
MTTDEKGSDSDSVEQSTLDTEHWFPPRHLCDIVIHYQGHSFFAHKLKLHEQSGWFSGVIQALRSPHKRQRLEEEEKDEPRHCTHDPSLACVEVPAIHRRFKPAIVSAQQFRGFLYAMYFPGYEPYFPLSAKVKPKLGEIPDDVYFIEASQVYPPLKARWRCEVKVGDSNAFVIYTQWLDCAQYLQCKSLLARADVVLHGGLWAVISEASALFELRVAEFYELEETEQRAIDVIIHDHLYWTRTAWLEYEKDMDIKLYRKLLRAALTQS